MLQLRRLAADRPRIAVGARLARPPVRTRTAAVGPSAARATGAAAIAARTVGTPTAAVTRRTARARPVGRRVAQLGMAIEEAAHGVVEAPFERRGRLAEGRAEVAPLLLRPPDLVRDDAQLGVLVDAAADGVGGE